MVYIDIVFISMFGDIMISYEARKARSIDRSRSIVFTIVAISLIWIFSGVDGYQDYMANQKEIEDIELKKALEDKKLIDYNNSVTDATQSAKLQAYEKYVESGILNDYTDYFQRLIDTQKESDSQIDVTHGDYAYLADSEEDNNLVIHEQSIWLSYPITLRLDKQWKITLETGKPLKDWTFEWLIDALWILHGFFQAYAEWSGEFSTLLATIENEVSKLEDDFERIRKTFLYHI